MGKNKFIFYLTFLKALPKTKFFSFFVSKLKKSFSFDQVKKKKFGGLKKCFNKTKFRKNFWAIVLLRLKEGICKFSKKYSFLRSLCFFKSENVAAPSPLTRGQICRFFGFGQQKIYLIGRLVPIFEKSTTSHHPTKEPA